MIICQQAVVIQISSLGGSHVITIEIACAHNMHADMYVHVHMYTMRTVYWRESPAAMMAQHRAGGSSTTGFLSSLLPGLTSGSSSGSNCKFDILVLKIENDTTIDII